MRVISVCVCQLIYPAIYRPEWIMTTAGFIYMAGDLCVASVRLQLVFARVAILCSIKNKKRTTFGQWATRSLPRSPIQISSSFQSPASCWPTPRRILTPFPGLSGGCPTESSAGEAKNFRRARENGFTMVVGHGVALQRSLLEDSKIGRVYNAQLLSCPAWVSVYSGDRNN